MLMTIQILYVTILTRKPKDSNDGIGISYLYVCENKFRKMKELYLNMGRHLKE